MSKRYTPPNLAEAINGWLGSHDGATPDQISQLTARIRSGALHRA